MKQDRITHIYDTLGTFIIELDPDPVVRGPAYLQDLISKTRGYLNTVSVFTQEVHREQHFLELELDKAQAAFEISADELLAEDDRVKRLPSIDDRKAMINLILKQEKTEIEKLKKKIRSLGHVAKAIRHRQRELSATMSAIRLQNTLIQAELRTGSFYGDENNESRGDAWGKTKTSPHHEIVNEGELDALFNASAKEIEDVGLGEEEDPLATFTEAEDDEEEDEEPESEEEDEEEPESEEEEEPSLETGLDLAEEVLVEVIAAPPSSEPAASEEGEDSPDEESEEDPDIARFLGDEEDDFSDIFDSL